MEKLSYNIWLRKFYRDGVAPSISCGDVFLSQIRITEYIIKGMLREATARNSHYYHLDTSEHQAARELRQDTVSSLFRHFVPRTYVGLTAYADNFCLVAVDANKRSYLPKNVTGPELRKVEVFLSVLGNTEKTNDCAFVEVVLAIDPEESYIKWGDEPPALLTDLDPHDFRKQFYEQLLTYLYARSTLRKRTR